MMRFSERIKKREVEVIIQIDSIDDELKNGLWNVLTIYLFDPLQKNSWIEESRLKSLCISIWFSHFKEPIDTMPLYSDRIKNEIRSRFFNWDYLEIYDFVDFIAVSDNEYFYNEDYIEAMNFVLKRDLSGYRFVNGILTPIINEVEIGEIERAISSTTNGNLKGVNIHLSDALNKLSDKKNPDYRNSIKESISALESLCQKITGDPKAELGKALKILGSKLPIHRALEQGFIKIYGYTSDSDGIRHAMMEETNLDQEDALYMLIAVSSFINYLITKVNKAGLEISKI
jgi:hypothetical protein